MSSASAAASAASGDGDGDGDATSATVSAAETAVTTVSAPGKILLAGGYLVLESPNVGVVLAVNKRFYCTTQCKYANNKNHEVKKNDGRNTDNSSNNTILLIVTSPQFDNMTWKYRYHVPTMQLTTYNDHDDMVVARNDLIEKTLAVALLALIPRTTAAPSVSSSSVNHHDAAADLLPFEIAMAIHGDNDFYSLVPHLQAAQLPRTWHGIQQLASFLPVVVVQKKDSGDSSINSNRSGSKVLKTGLGSSACLVTSLVASLSLVFQQQQQQQPPSPTPTPTPSSRKQKQQQQEPQQKLLQLSTNEIFALAQICHSHAQGKIGSGFDVAAACYGSCLYQRICLNSRGGGEDEGLSKLLTDLDTMTTASASSITSRNAATRECLLKTIHDIVEWTDRGGGGAGHDSNSPSIKPLSLPTFLQVMVRITYAVVVCVARETSHAGLVVVAAPIEKECFLTRMCIFQCH
jgi:mevalonate kinase